MEIARSILKFIQEIVKCIHEFLEKEQMNESNTLKIQNNNNNNVLLHSKKTLLLQEKYDDDTNIIMAKEIEKELYHSNLIMIDNMENGKDKNHENKPVNASLSQCSMRILVTCFLQALENIFVAARVWMAFQHELFAETFQIGVRRFCDILGRKNDAILRR